MVDGQIVRFLYMKYLEPVTSAAEFAAKLNARVIASLDESSAVAQRVANKLAQRQFGNPWFCGICSFILLSLHALAWNAGSRFDGLDIIASAAAFNPIAFLSDPMRIIDTTLLHASWVHVLTNFMGFAVYGSVIERILGWRCVLAMFVVGSIVSIAASVIFSGTDLRVGASGGVMSFLGVFLFIVAIKPFPLPGTMLGMPMWIFVPLSVLSLGIFVPGVDWVAHTAGVTTGILAGAIMFRGAKQRLIDELLPVRIPTVLFLGCCVLIGAAIIDVSMRVTNLARGGRAATIEQILHSSASSDLITDVAWDELIERRESQSAVPNTIARLRQDHHLSAISRGFLAALLSIRGDADAAFSEQRAALLAVTSDDPARASRYAARLVRFAEEVPTAARMDLIASERCMEEISVQRAAGVPTRLEFVVHTKVGNEQHAANANDREQLSLRAAASTDCRASKSAWRINPDDWNHTVAMFHR